MPKEIYNKVTEGLSDENQRDYFCNVSSGNKSKPSPLGQPSVQDKQAQPQPTHHQPVHPIDKNLLYKKLPFVKRKMDFGVWIYKNRYGVTVTVLAYIITIFSFVSMRFDIKALELMQGFYLEMPPEKEEPKVEEAEVKPKEPEIMENEKVANNVKNITVNANAKLDGGLKDDKGTQASDIYKEAQEMQDKLNAGREAYQKGLADDQAYLNDVRKSLQKKGSNDKVREDSKVTGNVTISWSLDGRQAVYIHNPAYRCPGAGTVVVAITVNRNGEVVNAVVDKISQSKDACLSDMALEAARLSRFNVSGSAPEKQIGSITYLFVAQ